MNPRLDRFDLMVLGAIKSYKPERPAMRGDLQRKFMWAGDLDKSPQRLKASSAIKFSRKPAGWVVA